MDSLVCYWTFPRWTASTIPQGLRQKHNTQVGTWAKMNLLRGSLDMRLFEPVEGVEKFTVANQPGFIQPQQTHKIEATSDDVECQLEFWCKPEDRSVKKYKCSAPHSEIPHLWRAMGKQVEPASDTTCSSTSAPAASQPTMLDIGCGGGRNLLFFQAHGFKCEGWDRNAEALENIASIIDKANEADAKAGLPKASSATLRQVDLNDFKEPGNVQPTYDVIVCTVVLQFLKPEAAANVIEFMKKAVKPGGYAVIVSLVEKDGKPITILAHDAEGNPTREITLPFTFKPNELGNHFQGWDLIKNVEEPGQLHQYNASGEYYKLPFASLIAKKV